jgi:membrane-bound inhibitor of C-type lysozyme
LDEKDMDMICKVACCLALTALTADAACAQAPAPATTVQYSCAQGKTLVAEYIDGTTRMAPNGMPIPGGHVVLSLSDGKKLDLPQTLSGSGIRYANADESFVFWSKGDTAFVEEGPKQTQTYSDCVGQKKSAR